MTSTVTLDPRTADTIRRAAIAARSGNLGRACALAEEGLAAGGDVAALNAFLGMIRARSGDLPRAIAHLRAAHTAQPKDVTIACNLIATLIETDAPDAALKVATPGLALADTSLRIARYRGFLAQSLGEFAIAAEAYERVVAEAPSDFESWNNLGNARLALADREGSVEALQRAVTLNPGSPPTRLNLASALVACDRIDEAIATLESAARAFPDDAKPLFELYVLHKRRGTYDEALQAISEAVRRNPDDADFQLKRGIELGLAMRVDEAEQAYRNAIEIDPLLVDAYLGLAVNYEHGNREDELAPLVTLAEANGIDADAIAFIRALELRRNKRFKEALTALARVPPSIEPERSAHIRGSLLDRLGHADEAFAAFEDANRLHCRHASDPLGRATELREQLSGEIAMLTDHWVASWSHEAPPMERPSPIFLVGFPRSGTTLLDTILMGHPRVQVLEERPTLAQVECVIGGMENIPRLDAAGISEARHRYFAEAGKYCDLDRPALLVDKSPLYLNKVPVIHRIFPDARFILALRHPCDVLLSCFMSNFRLNAAMANFLRLEDAAAFYDLTFQYWERARSVLPIRLHTVTYENVVEDSEGELRPLFDFLDLEWHAEVLDHRRTAASRGLITTASYSQVTEPIYRRAAGRWESYRRHMEPIIPTLRPWVEKFGYSL